MKGSEADIRMAVIVIQDLVGIENVEEDIDKLQSNNNQITIDIDDNHIGTYKKTLYVKGSVGGKLRRAHDVVDGKGFKINIEINEYADGAGKFLRDMFGRDKEEWYERITALNGVKYIPVYLKGSDEDMKKAVALIYQLVGRVNVEEAIESEYQTTTEEGTTVYVKAPARRNLKIGTIIKKIPVYSIDAERSTVKASNGETYVLVHIKGSEETIQKAIALIQKDVGMDNVVETIELPVNIDDGDIADRRASSVCQSKTLYVKSSTVQRNLHLLDGKEIISKSGLESLRFERESNRSLIMKEIKTSNGINYVAVHLKGSEEAMRKAIHRMKEVVGNNNVKDEIDMLPDPVTVDIPPVDILPTAASSDNRSVEEDGDHDDDENRLSLSPVSALVFLTLVCMLYGRVYFPDKAELLVLSGSLVILALGLYQLIGRRFQLYQAKRIEQTIYVDTSQSKCITGKQGRRKRKGIVNKSGVEDIQIDTLSDSDDYLSVYVVGSRKAVQKAIVLIQEAVGIENVEFDLEEDYESEAEDEYVSTDQSPDDPQTQTVSSSAVSNTSVPSEPRQQNQETEEESVKEEVTTSEPFVASPLAVPLNDQLQAMKEEEVPSELISNSTRGIAFETTTEASISSTDDGSKASKKLPTADLIVNDPLLIFLQSQHQCIKGSVDEFYTWLVKSEDIDSMIALQEAVNEDEYLNTKIKNGNGSSGLKGFKIPPFKRAVLAYDNTKSLCQLTREPPDELVCPISLTLMTNDPVVAADGITYERASIEDWFKKSKEEKGSVICSPVHGTEMKSLMLTPHIGTRNMARAFKDEK